MRLAPPDPPNLDVPVLLNHFRERFEHLALVRYLELWGAVTVDKFCRALGGNVSYSLALRHYFNGAMGGFNGMGKVQRVGAAWFTDNPAALYRRIAPLPPEGIARARALAYELRAAREQQISQSAQRAVAHRRAQAGD